MPLYCAVDVRLAVLNVTPESVSPSGSWDVAALASSVTASADPAQSSAPAYRFSRSASQLQVAVSSGTGKRLISTPSLVPVQNAPVAGSHIRSTNARAWSAALDHARSRVSSRRR